MLGPRLDLRQSQSLVMTPQLRQAIKLLQSSNAEVMAFVEEELAKNPLLEREEASVPVTAEAAPADAAVAASSEAIAGAPLDADFGNVMDEGEAYRPSAGSGGRLDFSDDLAGIDEMAAAGPTLRERLAEQIRLGFADPKERLVASLLLAMVEPSGRLLLDSAAIAGPLGCAPEMVERVRRQMARFEPVGMFCRDLRECLTVQLAERGRLDPFMERLLDNLPLLAGRDMKGLMAVCGVDAEELAEMVAELRRLDPKPGAGADDLPLAAIQPDVLMRAAPGGDQGGGWVLELNPDTLPRVLVNRGFAARAAVHLRDKEQKTFLADQLQSANWLVKSLEQRAGTILKVAAEIVRRQDGFLRHGIAHLRPLILRDVAEAIELHESTVSRVTANKYIATPRGTLELKFFFTTAIQGTEGGEAVSAEAVRHRIRDLVAAETAETVLSDDAIVARLREEGVDIARRTVAKYRDALRIPSSVQRKREKAATA